MEEFEIKFLEVNTEELQKELLAMGAKKVGEYDYTRVILDYPDFKMDKNNSWLKLRTDGKETTLSYKQRQGVKSDDGSISDEGMKEIEIVVDDYQKTLELLKAVGLVVKREQKNKRLRYQKDNVVFDIDFWPKIPPYVEIESGSLEEAKTAAEELGFDPQKGLIGSPDEVYRKYGIDLGEYAYITFDKFIKK